MRRTLGLVSLSMALPLSAALAAYVPAEATVHHDHHHHHRGPSWQVTTVGADEELRGLAPVGRRTAWVSGDSGGVWRTTDRGRTWRDVPPAGSTADTLYRDIEATDARHAVLLAIGEGEDSRILRTDDGGATWETTFVNDDPNAFYDCLAMWPGGRNGLAVSDPPDGRFRIIRTHDSGRTWSVVPNAGMPPAADGEFGFAASGTCLVTAGARDAFLASGGAASRIFRSHDRGTTWTAVDSPIPPADAGGTFGLASATRGRVSRSAATTRCRTRARTRRRTPATVDTPGTRAATSAATAPASRGYTGPGARRSPSARAGAT
jgi:photosystem II stability/assembly factor-like uncharacterized protein